MESGGRCVHHGPQRCTLQRRAWTHHLHSAHSLHGAAHRRRPPHYNLGQGPQHEHSSAAGGAERQPHPKQGLPHHGCRTAEHALSIKAMFGDSATFQGKPLTPSPEPQHHATNPKPQTQALNPEPQAKKPSTPKPELQTPHHNPQTLNPFLPWCRHDVPRVPCRLAHLLAQYEGELIPMAAEAAIGFGGEGRRCPFGGWHAWLEDVKSMNGAPSRRGFFYERSTPVHRSVPFQERSPVFCHSLMHHSELGKIPNVGLYLGS